jgi:hypothetical protein
VDSRLQGAVRALRRLLKTARRYYADEQSEIVDFVGHFPIPSQLRKDTIRAFDLLAPALEAYWRAATLTNGAVGKNFLEGLGMTIVAET